MKKSLVVAFLVLLAACGEQKEPVTERMQAHIDAAAVHYDAALAELGKGADTATVGAKYRPLIFAEHAEFKKIFDSLSTLYTEKKMDPKDYDRYTKSLKFEGVLDKTDELRKAGVKIELSE